MRETPQQVTPQRVLVVDDDLAVGTAIRRALHQHDATFAQSASGGLARIQAGARFEAIVCDVNMPGMSGVEFYDEVAKIAPRLARRTVFVTGSPMTAELKAFFDRTQCVRLEKPFHSEALRATVAAVCRRE